MKPEVKPALEEKKPRKTPIEFIKSHPIIIDIAVILLIVIIGGAFLYLQETSTKISVDNSIIQAPVITLSPLSSGILDKLYVKEGDSVSKSKIIALVNGNPIYAKTNGIVISVQNTPGQVVSSQTQLVQMIDPRELRVVGSVQENKGLKDVRVGERVTFSVDAFPGKVYEGSVDSISSTSKQQDIVFSISNQRPENDFDVKVIFDINRYPELKNGMSAKMTIYK